MIRNTQPQYAKGASDTVLLAYGLGLDEDCADCVKPADIQQQIERFPEGQFVAVYTQDDGTEWVVGMAATMRSSRPPTETILSWMEHIGDRGIRHHEPDGAWLYGVEMAVRPAYRYNGIGTRLYQARFQLVKDLKLRGWYAVGMLMGYHNYAEQMDVVTYGNQVIAGEIVDPTVSMQINRGFRAEYVVTDYLEEPAAGDAGVLIVWDNPAYRA